MNKSIFVIEKVALCFLLLIITSCSERKQGDLPLSRPELLNETICKQIFHPVSKWSWQITLVEEGAIGSDNQNQNMLEPAKCYAFGRYESSETALALVYIILTKYDRPFDLASNFEGVLDFDGEKTEIKIKPEIGDEIMSECLQDKQYMNCVVEARFDQIGLHLRVNVSRQIPIEEVEGLFNYLLIELEREINSYSS